MEEDSEGFAAVRMLMDRGCSDATARQYGAEAGGSATGRAEEAACLEAAFAGDAFWAYQGADPRFLVLFTLAYCARHGAVAVARYESGRVGAVACLVGPGQAADAARAAAVLGEVGLPAPAPGREDRTAAVGAALRAAQERACGARPRWHLWMLGTRPECGRRGLAGRLLRLSCHLADRDRLPLYLETDTAAPLYRRFGFETAEAFRVLDYAGTVEAMVRQPRAPAAWPADGALRMACGAGGVRWVSLGPAGEGGLALAAQGRGWERRQSQPFAEGEQETAAAVVGDDGAWLAELWQWDEGRDPLADTYRLAHQQAHGGGGGGPSRAALPPAASRSSFLQFALELCGSRQALLWQQSCLSFAPVVNAQLPPPDRAPMRPALLLAQSLSRGASLVLGARLEGCLCLLDAENRLWLEAPGDLAPLVAGHYARHLAGLPLLDRAMVDSWHCPAIDEQPRLLPEALCRVFREYAARVALTAADGESFTYAQLARRAAALLPLLPPRGTAVAVLCHSSPSYVVSLCACLLAGCPYVPADPAYPAARVLHMLEDAGVQLLLSETGVECPPFARVLRVDTLGEPDAAAAVPAELGPGDAAYVIYTSGSTGRPKGALVEHRGLLGMLRGVQRLARLRPDDSALHFYGAAFDGSVVNVFLPLLAGARLALRGAGAAWLPLLRATSVAFLTPSVLAVLEESVLAGFRLVLVGGEALPPAVAARAPCPLLNIYGPTETTVISSAALLPAHSASVHAGPPLPGVRYAVVRPDTLAELPPRCAGELLIGGPGVARGYLNLPDKTAAVFVTLGGGERWYRSGDLALWLGDGTVQVLGRAEAGQVKIAGYRIELAEVEAALAAQPGVRLAVVLVHGDALVAFVAPRSAAIDRGELARRLPPYMLPACVELREDLPRTPNGKVDGAALLASLAATTAATVAPEAAAVSAGLLQRFCQLCQRVAAAPALLLPDEPLHDLNSISAVRLVSLARRELGLALSLESLLRGQKTLRALLAEAGRTDAEAAVSFAIAPVSRKGNCFPLSRGQERLLALHLQSPGSCSYNVPIYYRFEGVSAPALAEATRRLFTRHETLRLTFGSASLEQSVGAHAGSVVLLQSPPQDLAELGARELTTPFDLRHSCARATIAPLAEPAGGGAALLLCCHHLVLDGLSVEPLLRDLVALLRNEALPPLRLQFVDYAAAERAALSEERVRGWLALYEPALRRLPPPLFAPVTHPIVSRALVEEAALGAERLPQFTSNVLCFALFLVALHRSGIAAAADIVAGTVAQNRQLLDGAEDMVGFFVNTVPLRVEFAGLTFGSLLRRCQEAFLAAMALQACPFDAVAQRFGLSLEVFFSLVDFVPSVPGAAPLPQAPVCKFGLELEAELLPGGRRARLTWLHDERRVPRERVEAAAAHFRALLEAAGPSLLGQHVQQGPRRLLTTATLRLECVLAAAELEARAQRLFAAAPLLCHSESEFVVQQLDSLDQAEPAPLRPRFWLALLVPESGPCGLELAATCCDRLSLERIASHLLAHSAPGPLPEATLPEPEDPAASVAFWAQRLAEAPLLADLPTDRVRLAALGDLVGCWTGAGPAVADAALLSVATGAVLGRHCVRQTAVIVGHVRLIPEAVGIGPLTSVAPLLVDCSGEASLAAVLAAARATLAAAAPHALPFELLASALDPDAGAGRAPLAQVSAALVPEPAVPGVTAHGPYFLGEIAVETDGHGRFSWFFRSELWDAETVAIMHGHLAVFLANASGSEQRLVREVEVMSAEERALLSRGFLERGPLPQVATMHGHFLAHCARDPAAPAVWEAGVTTSYGALLRRARRLSLPARAPVGVLLARGADCAAAQLAVLLRGGIFVPIDPAYPAARIAFILEDAAVAALLVHGKTRALVPPAFPAEKVIDVDLVVGGIVEEAAIGSGPFEEVCYIMYTSGTTGNPKGVMVTHAGVVNYEDCWRAWTGCAPGDRCLWFAGVAFDASIENVWCTLASGACVVARGDVWLAELAECTMVDCTPSALSVVDPLEYPRLRFVSTGAEEMQVSCAKNVSSSSKQTQTQVSLRNVWCRRVTLFNLYGPTEATVACTGARMLPGDERELVSIGRPFWNMQAFVTGPGGELCPLGVPGELCFAGIQVSRGYRNRPDLTTDKFVPNRFSEEPGCATMYRTGDLARLARDGRVFYLGRLDSQVKLRGFRVELSAVESVLQACPGVEAACALVLRPGAPDAALAAFCTPAGLSEAAVRLECGKTLPPYMVPDRLLFLPGLPKTANGKIDKKVLADLAAAPAATASSGEDASLSPMEREMMAAFAALVGRPVTTHDRFFESGLNSISAMKLAFSLKVFGVEVTDILAQQTVAALARHCESRSADRRDALVVRLSAARRPSREAQRVIVLVHGTGGALGPLRLLAREMAASNPAAVILGVHLVRGRGHLSH